MAVLVEARSVIVRRDAIDERLEGGWEGFLNLAGRTLCTDGHLARVGFLHPTEVRYFGQDLQQLGLTIATGGHFVHAAVVDQMYGLTLPCDWLEIGRVPHEDGTEIGYAQLVDARHPRTPVTSFQQVAVHEGWTTAFTSGMTLQMPESEDHFPGIHLTSEPPHGRRRS